jgi:hypothetical protein
MGHESSLSRSQEPSIGPYPEPNQSNRYHPILSPKIHFNIVHYLRLGLPNDLFPSAFPSNILYAFLFSTIRATCPTHLILLDLMTLIILGEEYKL